MDLNGFTREILEKRIEAANIESKAWRKDIHKLQLLINCMKEIHSRPSLMQYFCDPFNVDDFLEMKPSKDTICLNDESDEKVLALYKWYAMDATGEGCELFYTHYFFGHVNYTSVARLRAMDACSPHDPLNHN